MMGVDELISPENLASEEIKLLISESAFTNSHDFEGGVLKMMGVKLEPNAPFVGKSVMDSASVFPGVHFMPIALKKENTEKRLSPGVILYSAVVIKFILLLMKKVLKSYITSWALSSKTFKT